VEGIYTKNNAWGIILNPWADFDLEQYIESNNVPKAIENEVTLLRFMMELTSAVAHVHKNNVRHFDIKPNNILVKLQVHQLITYYSPVLIDFGLSKYGESGEIKASYASDYYRPPEFIKGRNMHRSADVWGLGLVFLELAYKFYKVKIKGLKVQFKQKAPWRNPTGINNCIADLDILSINNATGQQNVKAVAVLLLAMTKMVPLERIGLDQVWDNLNTIVDAKHSITYEKYEGSESDSDDGGQEIQWNSTEYSYWKNLYLQTEEGNQHWLNQTGLYEADIEEEPATFDVPESTPVHDVVIGTNPANLKVTLTDD